MTATSVRHDDRTDVLGVGVSSINLNDGGRDHPTLDQERTRNYVCVTSVHGIMECRRDPRLRRIHNEAGMVTPDGMPLVWFSRVSGQGRMERVCGRDLMRTLTAVSAQHGYRQFYYGGAEGLAETSYPGLEVVGTFCPPFRELTPEEDDAIVHAINASKPDILWVGLSTPKQERWMARHIGRIDAPVMIGAGAAFDFLAGTNRQAPPWMQRNGLEWLFRLCLEPRRLWRRYAYIVPGFLLLAAGAVVCQAILCSVNARSRLRSQT